MKTETLEQIIKLIPITSTDMTRHHITGVFVQSSQGKITIAATNGHMLTTTILEDSIPEGKFMLYGDQKNLATALLKASKPYGELTAKEEQGSLVLSSMGISLTLQKSDNYPNYEAIIPKETNEDIKIAFDAEYLFKLAKAITYKKNARVVLRFKDAKSPIRVTSLNANDSLAVLMPCRI